MTLSRVPEFTIMINTNGLYRLSVYYEVPNSKAFPERFDNFQGLWRYKYLDGLKNYLK